MAKKAAAYLREREDAFDCTAPLGEQEMGAVTQAVLDHAPPTRPVEEGRLGTRIHKGVPAGSVGVRHRSDAEGVGRHVHYLRSGT